jgi:pullulanase/glycogen debranching enzyme
MKKPPQLEFKSQAASSVAVAGDFNDWCGSAYGTFNPALGKMTRARDGVWVFPLTGIAPGNHQYKFVVEGEWEHGSNRTFSLDQKGHLIDPTGGIISVMLENPHLIHVRLSNLVKLSKTLDEVSFTLRPQGKILERHRVEGQGGEGDLIELSCRELDLSGELRVDVTGLQPGRVISRPIMLDGLFKNAFISRKPLGPNVENGNTVFRVFSPRAKSVTLKVFRDPAMKETLHRIAGERDADGVWEMPLAGTPWGVYYGFVIDGPRGEGEGFDSTRVWPDAYGKAGVYHNGPSLLIDVSKTDAVFPGWTDQQFKIPAKEDLIIWEASVRDLTSHQSSGVFPGLRGKFLGLQATLGKGTGIDHMKRLGVNAVEFLPVHEFDDDPPGSYHWGYMTSNYFSPDAWFATSPHGNQVNEFKSLINTLHQQNIAVLLDVVYNHTGAPNVLMGLDRKYFHRHDGNMTLTNSSGCGNDLKSENPMARRLIIDSLEYWVKEYHVDGFRFDLAELIDLETLGEIEKRLKAIKPDIILISEPWSFRGTHKGQLKNTSWASWNDDFRNRVREAAMGRGHAGALAEVLIGSLSMWTASPWESVNYVESHDDYTITDHLSMRTDRDGNHLRREDIARNLFAAAAVLLSSGIPMLAQGQEMLRSKGGNNNSYNAGDGVNAVNYALREKHPEVWAFYQGLIEFRQSPEAVLLRFPDHRQVKTDLIYATQNACAIAILRQDTQNPKNQLLCLYNYDQSRPAVFPLKLTSGRWIRRVGDQKVSKPGSPFGREMIVSRTDHESATVTVPPISVEAWVLRHK